MKDYRITVKVRNNRLIRAIEASGGALGRKWCDANNLAYPQVNDLVNLTISPITERGTLRSVATRLCDVLGKLPEELWSNEQLYPLEKNFSEIEMDYAQLVALLPEDERSYVHDFSSVERDEVKQIVSGAVSTLTDTERQVIAMRFDDDLTQTECSKLLTLSQSRVRQIEEKALRKLRHPSRLGGRFDLLSAP